MCRRAIRPRGRRRCRRPPRRIATTKRYGVSRGGTRRACETCQVSMAEDQVRSYVPSMDTTIGRMLTLLIGPPALSESEVAGLLGLDLAAVRMRLVDLRRRGILAGPIGQGTSATWTSWFPTPTLAIEAAHRSGLRATSPVRMLRFWWQEMWAHHERPGSCRQA
jgi:hypothetical protein